MTVADFPTPPSEPDSGAPEESHAQPDPQPDIDAIEKLFPTIPQDDSAALNGQEDVAENFTSLSSDDVISSDSLGVSAKTYADTDESADVADDTSGEPAGPTVVARYGLMGFLGEFRYNDKQRIRPGNKVVIRTDRGVELGEVVSLVNRTRPKEPDASGEPRDECASCPCPAQSVTPDALNRFLKASSDNYPFRRGGRVLRVANPQDLIDFRHLCTSSDEECKYCREQIKDRNLPMRLVKAEHMLGGERIVFYFTAETRVDFRNLVRDLASQFRTRIEMRQVGARDEARLVADYERCGRHCCCKEFLKDLKPVSMRMAKVQKATLDPTKISGRCGRLMCCLRYEDDCYEELKKTLPRRNTWVRTKTHIGCVVDGQIITQLVRLSLYDGTFVVVPVEDILERNITPPSEEELRDHAVKQAAAQRSEARRAEQESMAMVAPPPRPADESPLETEDEKTPFESAEPARQGSEAARRESEAAPDEMRKKRRRRRRGKPSGDPNARQGAQGAQGNNTPGNRQPANQQRPRRDNTSANTDRPPAGGEGDGKSSRNRRGRRRRRRPNSGGGGGNPPPGGSPGGS